MKICHSKVCFKCGISKSLDDFYKHSQMKDGHVNKCKDCNKADVMSNYETNIQNPAFKVKEKSRGREKYHRLYRGLPQSENKNKYMDKYYDEYPEKKKARTAVNGIQTEIGYNNHHWSYNDEHLKDTIKLSITLHNKLHRYISYDKKSKMYLTLDGTLLDTKEKHLKYLDIVKQLF